MRLYESQCGNCRAFAVLNGHCRQCGNCQLDTSNVTNPPPENTDATNQQTDKPPSIYAYDTEDEDYQPPVTSD